VLFICATDEHGTPAELAAAAAGLPVADYCARQARHPGRHLPPFDLSYDHSGRSSSPQNHALTRHFFQCLEARGFIAERNAEPGLFARRRALPARPLRRGHCPHCGSDRKAADEVRAIWSRANAYLWRVRPGRTSSTNPRVPLS